MTTALTSAFAPPLSLVTGDGLRLHVAEWRAAGTPRGVAVLVHGLGEHAGRYGELVALLNAAGWTVIAHDHRGHGRSDGPRGHVRDGHDDGAALLRDLAPVIDLARTRTAGPLLLVGHSLGGLVAARFVAGGLASTPPDWHRPVDALVLSSPALDLGLGALQRLLLATMSRLAPDVAVSNGLKPAWVSRRAETVQAYRADPLVHDRVTARLVRFMVDAVDAVQRAAPAWRVPTLLLFAGSDRCVAPGGSRRFAAAAPASVVEAHEYAALFHEIFNEPERADVFATLQAWLDRAPA